MNRADNVLIPIEVKIEEEDEEASSVRRESKKKKSIFFLHHFLFRNPTGSDGFDEYAITRRGLRRLTSSVYDANYTRL